MDDLMLIQEVAAMLRAWVIHLTGMEPDEDKTFQIAEDIIKKIQKQ